MQRRSMLLKTAFLVKNEGWIMNGILKEGQAQSLKYFVFSDRSCAGEKAALDIAETMLDCLNKKDVINMIFAAAPSQNETLASLLSHNEIPWNRVNAFHMDEYIGLPADAPQGFGNFLRKAIFGKAGFRSVNYINGGADDINAECQRYTELLKNNPVDIVCLGIGENGHIAFNDPGVADFNDTLLIKKVPLDDVCRMQQVNDGCFAALEDVPEYALTLTIPALISAEHMFCTVPAATKRAAVKETISGPIDEHCPASILREHRHAVLYADAQSGADLLEL